jgi:hypothetical protein
VVEEKLVVRVDQEGCETSPQCSMDQSHPENIGKTVEVKASNRPIKVAYVVPHDEKSVNHMIVDAVFHESYARWAGAYTLVIPASSKEFLHSEYGAWLEFFDPDFVYTYLELDPSLVETIDRSCSPIAFLRHKEACNPADRGWRAFIPDWGLYFQAVSSLTTIPSPYTQPTHFMARELEAEVTVATQYPEGINGRLFSDNFGTAFHSHAVTYAVPGLYRTLCLVPPDLPQNHVAGTERCTSMADMLSAISTRKVRPIARFAMAHSEAISRAEPYPWADCFNLFVGNTLVDRIHFWNARHFTPSHAASLGSIILEPEFFNDPDLVTQLGQYLNNNNFLGQGHGPARVSIRSYSQTEEELRPIVDKLRAHTYNLVFAGKDVSLPAVLNGEDLKRAFVRESTDTSTIKLTEDSNTLTAKEPSHFTYLPPRYKGLANGQWITELDIQRHNNLSKYSNVIDTWELPRRRKIVQVFTNKLGKVTTRHRLAVLPVSGDFPFTGGSINQEFSYGLSLPDDETFFRYLVLDVFKYPQDDLRATITTPFYQDLQLSDKGQNLRGVISMFHNLSAAYEVLTNKYWRQVLRAGKIESVKHLVFTRTQLNGYLPNDRPTREQLKKSLRLADVGKVAQYLKGSLTDTLEYLIRTNVFFCVHQWRCEYCGHTNSRSFDSMKIRNDCEICSTEYLTSIDLEWTYQLNEFVYRSLVIHTGLPVLWTLGFLQDRFARGGFWYLPEVDLFEKYDAPQTRKEIDILCMRSGKFIAVEVKRSASQLINNPETVDSFVQKMNLIRPDIAILSFEHYCDSEGDAEAAKTSLNQALIEVRKRIDSNIKVETIVASETQGFNHIPADLGYFGRHTSSMH